jgi:transcriptional regulator GlxA family with amidase domain
MNVEIIVFDGADELDFVGPYEVLARAIGAGISTVRLVTLEPQDWITAAHGLQIRAQGILSDHPDLVIVPGGGWVAKSAKGIRAEIEKGILTSRIAALHGNAVVIAGVCTGAMALAASGILDGKEAITHHGALEDLRKTKAHVVDARVVDSDSVITCGGVTSSIDLALWIVERFCGEGQAKAVAGYLEYPYKPRTGSDRPNADFV